MTQPQDPAARQRQGARQLASWVLLLIAVSYVVWMYAYPMAYSKPDQVLPYRILASSKNFNELTSVLGSLREQGPALDLGAKSGNDKTLWVLARIPADTVERTRVLHIANRSVQKGDAVILDEFGQALLYAHFNNEQEPVNAARALPGYAITLPELPLPLPAGHRRFSGEHDLTAVLRLELSIAGPALSLNLWDETRFIEAQRQIEAQGTLLGSILALLGLTAFVAGQLMHIRVVRLLAFWLGSRAVFLMVRGGYIQFWLGSSASSVVGMGLEQMAQMAFPCACAALMWGLMESRLQGHRFGTWLHGMYVATGFALAVSGLLSRWWQVLVVAVVLNIVLLGLVVGFSPRSIGRRNPDGTLLVLAGALLNVDSLGAPWRWVDSHYGRSAALTDAETRAEVTEDLREMIDEIGEAETIEDEDREMMRSVVELGRTLVREVMVPRPDMVTIDAGKPASTAMRLFVRSGYSRVPVVGEDADDVRGILYLKDVLRRLSDHPEHETRPVSSFTREAVWIPETKPADDLLREMQTGHVHMVLAVDEYGGTAGLVTMEDLLEEVVGELTDEHDHAEPEAVEVGPGTYRVPVRLGLDELGGLFGLEIDDDDVDTAGGLLTKAIGRVPLPGAHGSAQGVELTAEEAVGRRRQVATLIARRAPDPDPADTEEQ